MSQFRVAIAIVVLTEDLEWWEGEGLQKALKARSGEIESLKVHNFGIPMFRYEDDPVLVEIAERDRKED